MVASAHPLKIVVVGAGIAGLAAALRLAQQGHQVHVYEAARDLSELGAGIQIPPNAARILYSWGLGESIEQLATVPAQENLRRYSSGEIVGHLRRNTRKSFGYESMTIHRADLQKLLFDKARLVGVTFTFATNLTSQHVVEAKSSYLRELREADLIIAADGISSALRKRLFSSDDYLPRLTGDTASRVILPRSKLEGSSKLRDLVRGPTNNVWMGPKRHIVAYTIRDLELYNVVLCGPGEAPIGVYNEPCDPRKLEAEYSDFEDTVHAILREAETSHRWLISEVPPLPSWTGLDGRLVLLGDAAHAMMPYAAQGAAQGFEDAAVLATCLSGAKSGSELGPLLAIYEKVRKPRSERVAEVARGNRFLYGLEDGPEQQERDARFRQTLQSGGQEKAQGEADGLKDQARPTPDSQAKYGSSEFSEWLYRHDVVEEATSYLHRAVS